MLQEENEEERLENLKRTQKRYCTEFAGRPRNDIRKLFTGSKSLYFSSQ